MYLTAKLAFAPAAHGTTSLPCLDAPKSTTTLAAATIQTLPHAASLTRSSTSPKPTIAFPTLELLKDYKQQESKTTSFAWVTTY